jgi:hypothetical protein
VIALILGAPFSLYAFYLGPGAGNKPLRQVANVLRKQASKDDLIHASAPDSAVLLTFMGPEHAFHVFDLILLRKQKQAGNGRVWLLVDRTRADLQWEMNRLALRNRTEFQSREPILVLDASRYALYVWGSVSESGSLRNK